MNIIVCRGQCLSSQNQDIEIISVFSTRVIKKVFLNEIINNLLAYYELSYRLEVIGLELSRFEIVVFGFRHHGHQLNSFVVAMISLPAIGTYTNTEMNITPCWIKILRWGCLLSIFTA